MLKKRFAKVLSAGAAGLFVGMTLVGCGGDKSPDPADQIASSSSSTGSTGTSGTTGGGGAGTTGGEGMCTVPSGEANNIVYSGARTGPLCGSKLTSMAYNGNWFTYHDATDAGVVVGMNGAQMNGCDGAQDCAYHSAGQGFADYGAGMGFDLTDDSSGNAQPTAVTPQFSGIRFYAKGTITGTRTSSYAAKNQTIHLKLVTATDRHGDDFGKYCENISIDTWTICELNFGDAIRDGFYSDLPTSTDSFDGDKLLKVQFELSRYSTATDDGGAAPPVDFDFWVDNVAFF